MRALLLTVLPLLAAAQSVTFQASLPQDLSNARIGRDAAGGLYLAGSVDGSVYLARLDPADFSPVWEKMLVAGSAAGLAVTGDGGIFVAVTTGASGSGSVMRIDAAGRVVYAMALGGTGSTYISAIAANTRGEAFVTGARYPDRQSWEYFTTKINAQGTNAVWTATGTGGCAIALDEAGNIYVAGTASAPADRPATPGAFQSTFTTSFCGSGLVGFPCPRQFVSKLRADGTLAWSTFLTGSHSEMVGGMAVDSAGAVYVAGSTTSTDYPVTQGAFQTAFRSRVPPTFRGAVRARNAYITKVAPDGATLVWSSYVGGSGTDAISAIRLDSAGDVLAAGSTTSPDFPALPGMPERCRPRDEVPGVFYGMEPWPGVRQRAFVTALRPDGSAVIGTEVPGGTRAAATDVWVDGLGVLAAGASSLPADEQGVVRAGNAFAARIGWRGAGCLLDPADYASVGAVVPGQALSFFGSGGNTVTFSGTPGEVLYAADGQVNVRVPEGTAGRTVMEVNQDGRMVDRRILPVVDRSPALFVMPDYYADTTQPCYGGVPPLRALNEDGTENSCGTPAAAGSVLSIFVNGAGKEDPPPEVEVSVNRQPAAARYAGGGRIEVRLPEGVAGSVLLQVKVQGATARPAYTAAWVR
jgi:uncharacterized protein (TIGR03437 family)